MLWQYPNIWERITQSFMSMLERRWRSFQSYHSSMMSHSRMRRKSRLICSVSWREKKLLSAFRGMEGMNSSMAMNDTSSPIEFGEIWAEFRVRYAALWEPSFIVCLKERWQQRWLSLLRGYRSGICKIGYLRSRILWQEQTVRLSIGNSFHTGKALNG